MRNRTHPNMCAHYKSQTLAAIPLFGHTEMLHTPTEIGSAALAAAVPYQVKQPKMMKYFKKKQKTFLLAQL